ncbi:hypothetical protein B7494_g4869 [Chlorociboria aeruginascens]|nr:hypothetical protein B7494_g4869 [Chlorociboria aeruginascens]
MRLAVCGLEEWTNQTGDLGPAFKDEGDAKWQLGHVLQSLDIQNFAMDLLRNAVKERYNKGGSWPFIAEAIDIYSLCPPRPKVPAPGNLKRIVRVS